MAITEFPFADKTHQEKIKLQKSLVFDGLNVTDAECSALADEWKASLALGIDPHMESLGEQNLDPNTLSNISVYLKSYKTYYSDFFRYQRTLLAAHGSAIFYMDNNCSVYSKDGDKELLAKLKSRGIKFSTNFSEQSLGVNAVSISHSEPGRIIRRFGEENFLDIFSPYVCYSRAVIRKKYISANHILVLVPLEKFSSAVEELVLHLFALEEIISSKVPDTYEDKKMKLMKLSSVVGEDEILLCDAQGKIIYINETFEELVGIPEEMCYKRHLNDIFPNLSFCLRSLKTGQDIPLHETYVHDKTGNDISFYAECFVVRDQGRIEGLKIVLRNASTIRKYASELSKRATAQYRFEDMKGKSPSFMHVIDMARRAANGPSNILIFGESGTGKELLAHSIHNASSRRDRPFIPLNCAAIPKDLITSELFGYDDGAFTGAKKGGYTGKLEQANGGTIFLDEIGEMPFDMQATLLRFLEDGVIYKVGGKKPMPVDVRVIAATNKNLAEYVEQGKFRLDLYYRLNVVKLTLPPLRERTDDIPLLANSILERLEKDFGSKHVELSNEVMQAFQNYSWPGNLRQLRNVLEYCINIGEGIVSLNQLPQDLFSPHIGSVIEPVSANTSTLKHKYDRLEIDMISDLMLKHSGNKSAVAAELGIARSTLYRKLKSIQPEK